MPGRDDSPPTQTLPSSSPPDGVGFVPDPSLRGLAALSEKHGVPAVDLDAMALQLSDLDGVPLEVARRHVVLPVLSHGGMLLLAMAAPTDRKTIEDVEFVSGSKVYPFVAEPEQLARVIEAAYAARDESQQQVVGPRSSPHSVHPPAGLRASLFPAGRDVTPVPGGSGPSLSPVPITPDSLPPMTAPSANPPPFSPTVKGAVLPPPIPAPPLPPSIQKRGVTGPRGVVAPPPLPPRATSPGRDAVGRDTMVSGSVPPPPPPAAARPPPPPPRVAPPPPLPTPAGAMSPPPGPLPVPPRSATPRPGPLPQGPGAAPVIARSATPRPGPLPHAPANSPIPAALPFPIEPDVSIDSAPASEPPPKASRHEPSAPSAKLPPPTPAAAPSGRTVWVVEPDMKLRRELGDALCAAGHQVVTLASVSEFVNESEDAVADLAVIDPANDESALGLLQLVRAREAWQDVPWVFRLEGPSGWRVEGDLAEVFGVRAVLPREGDAAAVASRVDALLGPEAGARDPVEAALSPEASSALDASVEAYQRGEMDEAAAHIERALALSPRSHRLHYHLGLIHGRRGELFRAVAALETGVSLNPRFFPALKNLAVLYERVGFRRKAMEAWERACLIAPDDATRGQIKERLLALL